MNDDRRAGQIVQTKPDGALTCTIDEAAKLMGVSRSTMYEAARTAQIFTIRLGRRVLVPRAAIEKMLNGGAAR